MKRRGKKPIHVIDRLLARCVIQASGCVTFGGHLNSAGYGHIGVGSMRDDGRRHLARTHRVSYKFFRGSIPKNKCVLHKCDNRACCNPEHLFLGTMADNTADMMAKGRHKSIAHRGESHGMAKLKTSDVLAIRASSQPTKALMAKYGMSQVQICNIRRKASWRHV